VSVQVCNAVLKEFLTDGEPTVLALTGRWGTGKTHAWKAAVKAHRNAIQFHRYCYVSLFGINSMTELRMALFTKSAVFASTSDALDFKTVNEHGIALLGDWFKSKYERLAPLLKSLPHGTSMSLGLEALAPSIVHDTLICLDDFERQTSIKPEEILGLITELSEERGCKVALIFNSEQLGSKEIYRAYREKVIDLEVKLEPTTQEAFDLVFEHGFPHRDLVYRHVADLGVTNVRILRKMHRLMERINAATKHIHANVVEACISTTVLLCWCSYAPDASKPNADDIASWNATLNTFKSDADHNPENTAWAQRLKAYGFSHVDDLDLAIARVVERGHTEGTGLLELLAMSDKEQRTREKYVPFGNVWRRFHGTFSDDQDGFIKDLYGAALEAINQMTLGDLNSTVRLLRELKSDDQADDLIEKYLEANKATPETFELKDHPFQGSVDDARLRDRLAAVSSSLKKLPSLAEAITFIVKNSGYNDEHIEAMEQASVDDYEALFRNPPSEIRLESCVKWSMRWANTEHAAITATAGEALTRIKASSLLNQIRTSRFGV